MSAITESPRPTWQQAGIAFRNVLSPIIAGIAVLAILAGLWPALATALQYDRHAISNFQLWRIATGHVTHWNADDQIWDLVPFVGLSFACAQYLVRRTIGCVLGSALAITGCLWFLQPEITHYRGLSGIDSALFVLLTAMLWRDARSRNDSLLSWVALVGLLGFFAKVSYEWLTGEILFVDSHAAGFIPLASAHLVGGTVGLISTRRR